MATNYAQKYLEMLNAHGLYNSSASVYGSHQSYDPYDYKPTASSSFMAANYTVLLAAVALVWSLIMLVQ